MRWTCAGIIIAGLVVFPDLGLHTTGAEPSTNANTAVARPEAPNTTGTITGTVKLEGPAPKGKPINMAKEAECVKLHRVPVLTEEVVTGEAGTLQNVIVFVSEGLANPISDPPPAEPAVMDQKGCTYHPHVLALEANQKLRIVNSDPTSHNIHPLPRINREWNKSQPPGMPPLVESFAREEIIPVKCNVHPWMRSYIAVFKHPYFAVTGPGGTFDLKNLPPGNYTIAAWHEKYGTQTQTVSISANESKTVQFIFKVRADAK